MTPGELRLIHKEQNLCNTCIHAPICALNRMAQEFQAYLPTISACGAYTHHDDIEVKERRE